LAADAKLLENFKFSLIAESIFGGDFQLFPPRRLFPSLRTGSLLFLLWSASKANICKASQIMFDQSRKKTSLGFEEQSEASRGEGNVFE
jgi:hypothetical protein